MLELDSQYTKLRWLLTCAGLVFYVVDIWTDIVLALRYFAEDHLVWTGLTVLFVLAGMTVTQVFSYAWYLDDASGVLVNVGGGLSMPEMSPCRLLAFHLFGMGIFTRYYFLLRKGFAVVWRPKLQSDEVRRCVHQGLFALATNLSMLKLFEAFLESVPQLLLQLYIILSHDEFSVLQCLSVVFSLLNVAWSLVDYRRCLRRSQPHMREMQWGLPTAVYLLYKFLTISSHILSFTLLLILSTYTTVVLGIIWLLGATWSFFLQTNFCSCRSLEWFYRAIVGVILMFTFFNVNGQDTRIPMSIYYVFFALVNTLTLMLLASLDLDMQNSTSFVTIGALIFGGTVLGLACLVIYYVLLHPRGKLVEMDEVDGPRVEAETTLRFRRFLQP